MRVFYVGCNLFGQVTESPEISFKQFIDLGYENLQNFIITHSVFILQQDNAIYFHGHGLKPRETHVVTKLELPQAGTIKDLSASDTRTYLISDDGKLYMLDFLDDPVSIKQKINFLLEQLEENDKIVKYRCGIAINVALSEKGCIYNVPNKLNYMNKDIIQICAGNEHCLFLDAKGDVYSFGNSSRGQLGHGSLQNLEEPQQVDALAGIKITKIACGGWHCCALSEHGDVYVWGWNSNGQLGLCREDDDGKESVADDKVPISVMTVPTLLEISTPSGEDDVNIIDIGCGSRHSVFISDKYVVYGCGCNSFNQLGETSTENIYSVTKIYEIDKTFDVQDIACGPASTAILCLKKESEIV